MDRNYEFTWTLDDLPSAYITNEEAPIVKYESGIPLGEIHRIMNEDSGLYKEYYTYNHHDIVIEVHESIDDADMYRIVGFRVEPQS